MLSGSGERGRKGLKEAEIQGVIFQNEAGNLSGLAAILSGSKSLTVSLRK
jgi:hypothetical protein